MAGNFRAPKTGKLIIENSQVSVKVDLTKYPQRVAKAQRWLDKQVARDMGPYIPFKTGEFKSKIEQQSAQYIGQGIVYAAVPPQGVYLYNGVCRFCGKPLKYTNPMSTPKWFQTVKARKMTSWKAGVERIIKSGE